MVTTSPYPEYNGIPGVPGDCGQGIHLRAAADPAAGSVVSRGSGRILLS